MAVVPSVRRSPAGIVRGGFPISQLPALQRCSASEERCIRPRRRSPRIPDTGDLGTSVIFITHDLGVVAQIADDVAVMYLGRLVEQATVREVLKDPLHPYTVGLLKSLPRNETKQARLPSIIGNVPSLTHLPAGCPFHPRCPDSIPGVCDVGDNPVMEMLPNGRLVSCCGARKFKGATTV